MKKRNLLYILLAVLLPLTYVTMSSNSGGNLGNSTSGCSCHGMNLTTTALSITGIPAGGYVGGTTYSLTATVTNPNYTMSAAQGGFNISCTEGSFNATTGVSVNSSNNKEITHDGAKAMSSGAVSWTISWTAPPASTGNVTFHFAGNATNGNSGTGGDQPNYDPFPFTEAASTTAMPTVSGVTVTNITGTDVTVNAMVTANGLSTGAGVEYGLTNTYGSSAPMSPAPITGTTATAATGSLTGLTPNTTYHYRITATNTDGTTNSADATFMTGAPNSVPTFAKSEFSIFPNPASDMLNIELVNEVASYKVAMYNFNGQQVISPEVISNGKKLQLDISGLSAGSYILHAMVNEKQIIQKISVK